MMGQDGAKTESGKWLKIGPMLVLFSGMMMHQAIAQEVTPDADNSDSADAKVKEEIVLDEIKVTAQKRVEDVQDIPLAVTAIGGDAIKEMNLDDLNAVSDQVPNLTINDSPGVNTITIRGIGSGINRGFDQSVAIIIDDVFYARGSYLSNGLLDLAGIEVLRGPQGTLYGKNSPAGAIHIKTGLPKFEWGGDADVLYGTHENLRVRGAITGPVMEDLLAFRLAVGMDEDDGTLFNTTTGMRTNNRDNLTGRTKFLIDNGGRLKGLIALNYQTVEQQGGPLQHSVTTPRHLAAMQVFDPAAQPDLFDGRKHENYQGFVTRESYDITGTVNWDIRDTLSLTWVSNIAFLVEDTSFDAEFSPIPFIVIDSDEDYRQISQEVRLVGGDETFNYVGGLFYLHTDLEAFFSVNSYLDVTEAVLITGTGERSAAGALCTILGSNPVTIAVLDPFGGCSPSSLATSNAAVGTAAGQFVQARQQATGESVIERSLLIFNQITDSYAAFGQATWAPSEHFALTVGTRLTYEVKDVSGFHELYNDRTGGSGIASPTNPTGASGFPVFQPTNEPFDVTDERAEFDVSPKLSLQYFHTEDLMAYVTIAKGFKSGGYNSQAINAGIFEYDGEESLTYETGLKTEFWDRRARFNLSAFWTDYEGHQISTTDGDQTYVTNAEEARIAGIEMDYALAAFPFLILSGNGAYTDGIYEDFKDAPCQADHEGEVPCDISGEQLTGIPRWAFVQNVIAFAPLGNFAVLQGRMTASYTSEYIMSVDLDPQTTRPAYWKYRLQTSLRDMDERWALSLFIDNLTDEEIQVVSSDAPALTGSFMSVALEARTYGVEFKVRY